MTEIEGVMINLSPPVLVDRRLDPMENCTFEGKSMRIYLILALILAIIVTIFAVQNIDPVNVTFLTFELNGSLALVLLITLTVGIIIGILVSAPSSLRRRREISGLKKSVRKMEKDLATARGSTAAPPAPQVEKQASGGPPAEEITEEKRAG